MRRLMTYLSVLSVGLACSFASAQDAKPEPASRIVAIEVLIADLAISDKEVKEEPSDAVVDRIRESEKQGKLSRVTRLRLTTLSEQQAMAQYGERAPVATGRASFASAIRGGDRPGPGGGEMATSFTYQNVGTMVQVTPRVDGNKVVMQCSVEQSRLVPKAGPRPAAPGGPDPSPAPVSSFQPESVETITAQSTVQMKSGQTVLLTSRQQHSGDTGQRTYILVTGTIQGD